MELRCSRELALWLGAIDTETLEQHRELKKSGSCMLVRDLEGRAMFWPIATMLTGMLRGLK